MRTKRWFKPLATFCRLLLAATFVVSGFTKVIDPWGTALKIDEYLSIYSLEWLEPAAMWFSIWLCGAEMMMGCMLLFKVRIRLISIFAFVSMIFFTVLTFLSATLIPVEDCGCFGEAIKLSPWATFIKNLVLLPLAVVVWWRYRPDRIFAFKPVEVFLTVFFFVGTMSIGVHCYRHLPLVDFLPYKVGTDILAAMDEAGPAAEAGDETVLVYRNLATGQLREFALDDTEWQDAAQWEWVDTRTGGLEPLHPTVAEFALRDAEGDATERILARPGRLYMLCVTSFDRLPRGCARRMARLVERAREEGAAVVCLTPQPLYDVWQWDFGTGAVDCCNIDASTMLTMLRARYGVVTLDDGVISAKRNCRDIRP